MQILLYVGDILIGIFTTKAMLTLQNTIRHTPHKLPSWLTAYQFNYQIYEVIIWVMLALKLAVAHTSKQIQIQHITQIHEMNAWNPWCCILRSWCSLGGFCKFCHERCPLIVLHIIICISLYIFMDLCGLFATLSLIYTKRSQQSKYIMSHWIDKTHISIKLH